MVYICSGPSHVRRPRICQRKLRRWMVLHQSTGGHRLFMFLYVCHGVWHRELLHEGHAILGWMCVGAVCVLRKSPWASFAHARRGECVVCGVTAHGRPKVIMQMLGYRIQQYKAARIQDTEAMQGRVGHRRVPGRRYSAYSLITTWYQDLNSPYLCNCTGRSRSLLHLLNHSHSNFQGCVKLNFKEGKLVVFNLRVFVLIRRNLSKRSKKH